MPSRRSSDAEKSRSARPTIPVAVKPATEAVAPEKKAAKRTRAKPKTKGATQAVLGTTALPGVSADERRALIARAAYLRGESRGFPPGGEAEDWLVAEKEVDALLSAGYRADQ